MKLEMIADYACVCGEGPLWHPDEQALYWHDIPTGRLFRYDRQAGTHEMVMQDRTIGALTIQKDGSLVLLRDRGNVVIWRDGQVVETIIEFIPHESRFNDAIADPAGRVYSGTMPLETPERKIPGNHYRIDPDGTFTKIGEGYGCANGMGFTEALDRMYFTDTGANTIYVFDYDQETGELSNRRPHIAFKNGEKPDGMIIDAEDHLWSAFWDGACVRRYDPQGRQVLEVDLPTPQITSVMFGGPDLDELYITSAGGKDKANKGESAGALFRLTGHDARGRVEYRSDLHPSHDPA